MQGSLPGTRQQYVAKWDVWEPPAAKRRTGRRNKPSLMETWHARRGGNSNKRLMGHGAFSTAAKYPPLLPLSVVTCSCSVPCWPRGDWHLKTQASTQKRRIFCHPFTPVLLRHFKRCKRTTQLNIVNIPEGSRALKESVRQKYCLTFSVLSLIRCWFYDLKQRHSLAAKLSKEAKRSVPIRTSAAIKSYGKEQLTERSL